MTNTTTAYLSIANNLARYQKLTTEQAAVKTATAYYQANIGKVTTIDQFVSNYRLLSYALNAYGLGDQINNTALIKQVLDRARTTSSKALANTLPNPAWKAFAAAFNFSASGSSSPTSSSSVVDHRGRLRRTAARIQRGPERSRRPARALFRARRADGHEFLSDSRRPEPARSRADHLRACLDRHIFADRRRSEGRRQAYAGHRNSPTPPR